MKIHDITVEIDPALPVWPGDPKIRIERSQKLEEGANANISRMEIGLHTGTHVDAPWHFLVNGVTLDKIPLERFIGTVSVLDIPPEVKILSGDTLANLPVAWLSEKVLFKPVTRNTG